MLTKYVGLVAAAVLVGACWSSRQTEVVSGGEVDTFTADVQRGGAIPEGAQLSVELGQNLSTKETKVGDKFTAKVASGVIARNGEVIVPVGAKVYGEVTGLDDADNVSDRGLIQLRVEAIEFFGKRYPLRATVTDVANVVERNRTTGAVVSRSGEPTRIGFVIVGSDLIAITTTGRVKPEAGSVISLGMGDVEHLIPMGTRVMLRVDDTVVLK
jgi:hypothetical protein